MGSPVLWRLCWRLLLVAALASFTAFSRSAALSCGFFCGSASGSAGILWQCTCWDGPHQGISMIDTERPFCTVSPGLTCHRGELHGRYSIMSGWHEYFYRYAISIWIQSISIVSISVLALQYRYDVPVLTLPRHWNTLEYS